MPEPVLLDPHFRRLENVFTPYDLERLRALADVQWGRNDPIPEPELDAVRERVVAILAGEWRYGDVARFPRLRAFLELGGGFPSPERLDYEACFARGIRVLSCAPAFGPAVAEMGLGLAIAASRGIAGTDAAIRRGTANWSHTAPGDTFTLYEKPMGLIGFGGLARALLPLLAPFRCPVRVYDPWLTDVYLRSQGVTPADLDTVLGTSRFVFVLATPTTSNRAFLDRARLGALRPDAVLVLLSRAHVVDFEALTDLLGQGRFRAALDVYPQEPFSSDHPLCRMPNVVLSSHRAGAIGEALANIGRIAVNDTEAILRGLAPQQMQVAQPEYIRLRSK